MGHIKLDELSTSLKEYIANLGLTEEQVNELIQNVTGDMSTLQTTEKTVAGAINELFQNANNGKELIADAIGEPLNSSDTFSAMSNGINNLKSQFKTALMNNGVSVESADKFKQLIEKLASLADSEGKGIKIAEGDLSNATTVTNTKIFEVTNLGFTPSIVIFINTNTLNGNTNSCMVYTSTYSYSGYRNSSKYYSSVTDGFSDPGDGYYHAGIYILENGFEIRTDNIEVQSINKWYAIGVGEEDTTLLDSLKSILEDEGVIVTEEDDMASLIVKTDNEFDNKNNLLANNKQALVDALVSKGIDCTIDNTWEELFNFIKLFKDYLNVNVIASSILCGSQHTFILKANGDLWATGDNSSGQLGLSATTGTSVKSFKKVNVDNVKQVICGDNFSYILKKDGTVWACGNNYYGQLGLGYNSSSNDIYFFKNIDITDVQQIACGGSHTMILKTDGTLWATGYNNYGQLGLGDTDTRKLFTKVDITDVAQVACGYNHTLVLKTDGTLWATGRNSNGQLGLDTTDGSKTIFNKVTTNAANIQQIFCGGNGSFILKTDGTAWSCGYNDVGQLGLGSSKISTYVFTKCTVTAGYNSNVTSIACGPLHTLMIKDNKVFACGSNSCGELGVGDTNDRNSFVMSTSLSETAAHISVGAGQSIAIDTEGNVYSCGDNTSGELGIGSSSSIQITFTKCGTI